MKRSILFATFLSCLSLFIPEKAKAYKQGGTVNVPVINAGFVENFNPYLTKDMLLGTMFEPLFVFNNLTGKTHFRLAESFHYSKDFKTFNLVLRDGLKWSDGMPLTAEDVEFSFNLIKKSPIFDTQGIWIENALIDVQAIDRKRVAFKLKSPDSTFFWKILSYPILPKHIWNKVRNIASFSNPNPVGSGPMTKISAFKSKKLQLCRNPYYYISGRPYLDCINFHAYESIAQAQKALLDGEVDWGSHFLANVEFKFSFKPNKHFWYPPNNAVHLYINTQKAPFNDLRVRQALSMALNRQKIVNRALSGYANANLNAGGIAHFYKTFIDQSVNEEYSFLTHYNVRQAKALLDKAGIIDSDGDGYRNNRNGSKIDISIDVVADWSSWVKAVDMISEYFDDIDIRTRVKKLDLAAYNKNLLEGNYDMSISWSKLANNPIFTYKDYYHSTRIGKSYQASHGINSKEIDALIDDFSKMSDIKKQREILSKLQRITAEKLPFLSLFSNPTWFQYNTKKIVGWPNEKNPYIQPYWHDSGKRVIILNNLHLK